jgi:hypothetical protein
MLAETIPKALLAAQLYDSLVDLAGVMRYPSDSELAKERMLQAEHALEDYFRSSTYNPEEEKQLADAVKVARDEYITQLAALLPSR